MHYATHVVSPLMAMVNGMAEYVSCFGSGTINDECARRSGSKFAVESCHIKIKDFGSRGPHLALPLGHGATVSRERRRLWVEEVVRMATDHRRESGAPHSEEAGAGDRRTRRSAGLCSPTARADPKFTKGIVDEDHLSFIQGGGHGGRIRISSTSLCLPCLRIGIHSRTWNSRRTGPPWGSALISRRSKAGRS